MSGLTIESALRSQQEALPTITAKAAQRAALQSEVEAFLAAGGQIRTVAIDTPTVPLIRAMTVSSKTVSEGKPRRGRPAKRNEVKA